MAKNSNSLLAALRNLTESLAAYNRTMGARAHLTRQMTDALQATLPPPGSCAVTAR